MLSPQPLPPSKPSPSLPSFSNFYQTFLNSPSLTESSSGLPALLAKEEETLCTNFLLYLLSCKVIENTVMGIFGIQQIVIFSIVFGILFFFLHRKNLLYVKIVYFLWSSIASLLLVHVAKAKHMLLVIPLYALAQPTYCLVVCRSIMLSICCFLVNIGTIMYVYWPEIAEVFNTVPGEFRYKVLSTHTFYCAELSFHFVILWGYLFASRKKYMMRLCEKQNELESLNKKLVEMNSELQESLRSKDNFLLSVSHELRNPLNSVSGNIELCLMQQTNPQVKSYLDSAKASCEMLAHLINNLLDSGKMGNSSLEVTKVPTNIRALLEKMWGSIKILMQRKGLQGGLYVAKGVPKIISTDGHRIMQILLNLVSNASKFTEKGSIKVVITWIKTNTFDESLLNPGDLAIFQDPFVRNSCPADKDNDNDDDFGEMNFMGIAEENVTENSIDEKLLNQKKLNCPYQMNAMRTMNFINYESEFDKLDFRCSHFSPLKAESTPINHDPSQKDGFFKISVIDSGCGMTKEDLSKLFLKFSQVGTDKCKSLGSGLGLWITKSLCKNMGGDITAFSQEGRGSIFTAVIGCEEFTEKIEMNSRIARTAPNHKPMNAMVVDDVESNSQIIVQFLKKCGVSVSHVAVNGLDALNVFKEQEQGFFDCIFMDIEMPKMDGRTACTEIRKFEEANERLPVTIAIVSGNYTPNEFALCTDKEGTIRADYMYAKPFTLTQCKNLVDVLESRRYVNKKELERVEKSEKVVLIVDDDNFNCKLLGEVFEKNQMKTMFARHGAEAVARVKRNYEKIRVIFMDCEMPVMDGCSATKAIKRFLRDNGLRDIEVFGLTGHGTVEKREMCLEAGMKRVFVKPISMKEVVEAAQEE